MAQGHAQNGMAAVSLRRRAETTRGQNTKETKMKKLMIAAAIVCAAAYVQAGCYTWGFSNGGDAGSETEYLESATAYLFLGTITETAVDGGYKLDFSGVTGGAPVAGPGTFNDPDNEDYTIGDINFSASQKADWATDNAKQAYSLIIFEADGVTDYANYEGKYALFTGDSALVMDQDSSTWYSDFTHVDAIQQGEWKTAAAVPEPTSGLLLLLGVAGMALRRRRA